MKLYHSTRLRENAESIIKNGFRPRGWPLRRDRIHFSNQPLMTIFGDHIIEVDVDVSNVVLVYHYEAVTVLFPYREFVFTADMANRFPRRLLAEGEAQKIVDDGSFWNWWPLGQPQWIYTQIDHLDFDEFNQTEPGEMSRYTKKKGFPCPCGQCN